MNAPNRLTELTRRELFKRSGFGFGLIALGSMLAKESAARASSPSLQPHFAPRAKHVIYLHMVGAPSQLDLFDHKPALARYDNRPCPQSFLEGRRFAFLRGHPSLGASRFRFNKYGRAGIEMSELWPHLGQVADELCVIRSMHTDEFNHGPAQIFLHTGFGQPGRASLGSWLSYGLGAESQDLPAYVVLLSGPAPGGGTNLWSSGFLPTVHQGIQFRSEREPVLFLNNPENTAPSDRRGVLDAVRSLNQLQLAEVGDPEIATRIAQYEMAFRMQTSVPELMDISREPRTILEQYGAVPGQASFANNCLLARRLVERGVRCVQLFDADWDHHGNLVASLTRKCGLVDRPMAALIGDLKRRGLLDETLVVWGGEFGRTPMQQNEVGNGRVQIAPGRDHHKDAFTVWLAGGGVKAGFNHGATDEFGFHIVKDPVHVHDLNATVLHLLGLNHERLTFRYQGRDFRLTDVHGNVVREILV